MLNITFYHIRVRNISSSVCRTVATVAVKIGDSMLSFVVLN